MAIPALCRAWLLYWTGDVRPVSTRDTPRRRVFELQINALIYTVVCFVLMFVLIGFVLIVIYGIFYLVCVIIATSAPWTVRTTDTP